MNTEVLIEKLNGEKKKYFFKILFFVLKNNLYL